MSNQWFTNIKVEDVMSLAFKTVPANYMAKELLNELSYSSIEEVLVTDENGCLCGLLTKKNLLRSLNKCKIKKDTMIRELMINKPMTTSPFEDLNLARDKMRKYKMGRLPVIDQKKKPLGVLTAMEVCNGYSMKLENMGGQLETVFNTVQEAIILVDKNKRVNYWNAGAEKIYGIERDQILGKTIDEFFPESFLIKVLETQHPIYNEYEITSNNKHLLKNAIPFFRNFKLQWVVGTSQDVTRFVNLISELNQLREEVSNCKKIDNHNKKIIENIVHTKSEIFRSVLKTTKLLARSDATVLILGESGTGKELMASMIHKMSNRREKPFVIINCAAIPESLFESEFFGYSKGAFTGAAKDGMPGKFELAAGGSLFLDEIGELSLDIQAKLLRVIQEKTFYRIGGITPIKADTRIIAATNKDLWEMVEEGKFREDLYYRLNVFNLKIPPLRKRKEDIPEFIKYFIEDFADKYHKKAPVISSEALEVFIEHQWRGNIRELRNFMERLIVYNQSTVITKEQAIKLIKCDQQTLESTESWTGENNEIYAEVNMEKAVKDTNLSHILDDKERQIIMDLLKKYHNNKSEVAKVLNMPRSTLYYRMKYLHIP